MLRVVLAASLTAALGATDAAAQTATWTFRWEGEGGYAMEGALAYDPALVAGPLVVAEDVSCFVIVGLRDGAPFGRWALTQLGPETTWRLHFDPARGAFVVEGEGIDMPQAWNMDGFGQNCGDGGFGFNLGNAAQDLCYDNELLVESQVPPPTPFPARRAKDYRFPADACAGPALLSLGPGAGTRLR